jgi:adenosylmethionine-8-amino-7-oxononanoate aminotransferase
VIFSNSGSEANEAALKLIRAYWKLRGRRQKTKVLSRSFAYHGVTLATTSLTGSRAAPILSTCRCRIRPGAGPTPYGSGKRPRVRRSGV